MLPQPGSFPLALSCLLWSFVGFRRCRGRSFCLAAGLDGAAVVVSCAAVLSLAAFVSAAVLSAAAVASVALVATVAELLRLICAAFPR